MEYAPVLYAEDDEDDIFFMQVAWQKVGVPNPLVALKDGKLARQYLSGEEPFGNRQITPMPCLLLLDLKLPIITGFEILQWIREEPALKELKVVVISSSGQQLDIDLARKIGIQDYIIKPCIPTHLQEVVKTIQRKWL